MLYYSNIFVKGVILQTVSAKKYQPAILSANKPYQFNTSCFSSKVLPWRIKPKYDCRVFILWPLLYAFEHSPLGHIPQHSMVWKFTQPKKSMPEARVFIKTLSGCKRSFNRSSKNSPTCGISESNKSLLSAKNTKSSAYRT